jgi:hypothetical protein
MASSSTKQQSSRFSSFKVFKFTGSKPPRPPPKDPAYLYSASCNPSLASVSNHSLYSQPPLPSSSSSAPSPTPRDKTKPNGALSIRSASPTPSRALQSSPQHHPLQQQPPSSLSASSTLMPDSSSGSGKVGFFRKISTLGKRSASKSPRVTTTDDGESISRPWNVQVSLLLSSFLPDLGLNFFFQTNILFFGRARVMSVYMRSYANTAPYPHR